jgi:DeoR/GlpR family transcriptional regulator of sugar metabolism
MIKSANKTAIVSIAEKLNSDEKMKVCNVNAIDYLITDIDPTEHMLFPYANVLNVL